MRKNYDIIIIGSGLGGLVSALILAKNGLSVCVLEKNQQFGGNLQTFSRNKKIFDTGVHYLGGLSEGENLYRYFDFLGIAKDLKLKKMDEAFDLITFDNDENEYPISQGVENFVNNLAAYFPEEKENIQKYADGLFEVCTKFPRYFLGNEGITDDDSLYLNTKEFIDSLTENHKLRCVLAGSSFLHAGDDKCPLYVHALTMVSYLQSAYKCLNGGSQITKFLVRELRKYKVDLYKRSEVVKINKDSENYIKSVESIGGQIYSADRFISNIEISQTVKMVGEKAFKNIFVSRINSIEPVVSCFSIYVVLKPNTFKSFNHNYFHHKSESYFLNLNEYDVKQWPQFYMLSSVEDKKNPEYAESLTILTSMKYDEVKDWEQTVNTIASPGERGETYEYFKTKKAELLIAEVEKKYPELRDCIQHVYTSTPLSYKDYIGTKDGSMYGYKKESNNPYKTFFSPKTRIPNLFITGQTVNMHGILGVTVGAFSACSDIIGSERLDEMIKGY